MGEQIEMFNNVARPAPARAHAGELALLVVCPHCGAAPRVLCVGTRLHFRSRLPMLHRKRHELARRNGGL